MNRIAISILSLSLIFFGTSLGSASSFLFRKGMGKRASAIVLGFAGGIMISASFFGLLNPAIASGKEVSSLYAGLSVVIGFLLGGVLLYLMDKFIPHIHPASEQEEGRSSKASRSWKLMSAVTIHNIPEGLAVGFACGMALKGDDPALGIAALSLAIGIAIQNVPEGAAVSLTIQEGGKGKWVSFFYGVLSGAVEPIAGILGLFIASYLSVALPWLLSFAAGAMIYVTVDELLPTLKEEEHNHFGLWAFMIGFALMMCLELFL